MSLVLKVVTSLHKRGIAVWMVTGDNRLAAHAVAKQVGISSEFVMSEVRFVTNVMCAQALLRDLQRVCDGPRHAHHSCTSNEHDDIRCCLVTRPTRLHSCSPD
jgi:magnesium-transporting ATPase (P-type)